MNGLTISSPASPIPPSNIPGPSSPAGKAPASERSASAFPTGGSTGNLTVDWRRQRQTPATPSGFKLALAEGSRVLIAGAAAATRMVGLPTLSAAISRVGSDTVGTATAFDSAGTPLAGGSVGSVGSIGSGQLGSRVTDDLQLLALQDQIQREGRQIALVSNVMKARHETTKAAISNIRS